MKKMRDTLLTSTIIAGAFAVMAVAPAMAQEAEKQTEIVIVTGTRIQAPGVVSSSPITTIGAQELTLQKGVAVEKIIRNLPISVPADGQNVNNGTAGVATIDLRDLGAARNLILIDGKRITPYNINGLVDVSTIPSGVLERVDIVTGGASAVYGSDALSGAVNFILKRNYQGIEGQFETSQTGEGDGKKYNATISMGASTDDEKANVVLTMNYNKRYGVQFGDRPYGLVGVSTASGAGLGVTGAAQPANCGGQNTVPTTFGGSGTTLPARINMPGFDPDGAGPLPVVSGSRQFREDGTLGANCNQFNFNPYNYYQTPSESFSGAAYGRYEINKHAELYARLNFSAVNVRQQIAPSGIFNTPLNVPLNNPFLTASARQDIINQYNGARLAGALTLTGNNQNWFDHNANGVVDAADTVRFGIGRRTVEFGERSTTYDNNAFSLLFGLRGDIIADWNYDVSFQHGESDRTNISAGYTNVANAAIAVNTVSATTCTTATGVTTAGCVPLNLFGKEGSITPAMAAYSSAVGIEKQNYTQTVASASVSGPFSMVTSPFATTPLQLAFGTEYREETGETEPDECLKLAPASCLGGAGGNTLPVKGGFIVFDTFAEAIMPLIADKPFAQSLDLELGFRYGDNNISGTTETWKAGLNWAVNDSVRVRVMQQRAARAPNVGEIASPITSSLDNATRDPCSVANTAISATLRALCISTGMTNAQVGTVPDIIAGQINSFSGTNPGKLPAPEEADTFTAGIVFTPSFIPVLKNPILSLDYYDIEVNGYISELGAQEVLDLCYVQGNPAFCGQIIRQAGNLIFPGSGIQLFTQNLAYKKAAGYEIGAAFGLDLADLGLNEKWGNLNFSFNANVYTKNETLSSSASAKIDCLGRYGTQCGNPSPEYRHIQRTVWNVGDFQFSYLWRHIGEATVEPVQIPQTFAPFRKIDAFNYIDLTGAYTFNDNMEVTFGVTNVTNEDPPIVGGEIGSTASNGGNTFPSTYDPVGRVYSLGLNLKF